MKINLVANIGSLESLILGSKVEDIIKKVDKLEFVDAIVLRINSDCDVSLLEEIRNYIYQKKILCGISVNDVESAKTAISVSADYIKISSSRCNHMELINYISKNFLRKVHISTGMTTRLERNNIINRNNSFVIYCCTSNYDDTGYVFVEKKLGFSCNNSDMFYGQAAILNGAKWVEYHMDSDKQIKEFYSLKKWINLNLKRLSRIQCRKPYHLPVGELSARKMYWSVA